MKLYLSEKQIANLVSVLHEDDAATTDSSGGATSSPGTSATQSGGTGYPAVSKWESGLQRGPANQVGVTKWADVVGSKINRGKANQLKEQGVSSLLPPLGPGFGQQMAAADNEITKKTEKDFLVKHNAIILKAPTGFYKTNNVLVPRSVGENVTKYSLFKQTGEELQMIFFKKWFNTEWESYVPKGRDLSEILPNGTTRSFTINNRKFVASIKRTSETPPYYYRFNGYVGVDDDLPYNPSVYFNEEDIPYRLKYQEESNWEKYGNDILILSSFAMGFFFPAAWMAPILMTLNLAAVANSLIQGKEADAMIFLVFAFLPEIKYALGLKEISTAEAKQLALAFENATTEQAIKDAMNTLPTKLRDKAYQVLKKEPKVVAKELDKAIEKGVSNLTKEQTQELTTKLNQYIKEGLVNPKSAKNWLQKLGSAGKKIGKLGVELVAIGSLHSLLQNIEDKIKGKPPEYVKTVEEYLANALGKFQEMANANISEKFLPISKSIQNMLPKYKKTFGEDDGMLRFVKMTNRVQALYLQNQNQDFNTIINNIYNEDENEK